VRANVRAIMDRAVGRSAGRDNDGAVIRSESIAKNRADGTNNDRNEDRA
jgi:hypothetical protein